MCHLCFTEGSLEEGLRIYKLSIAGGVSCGVALSTCQRHLDMLNTNVSQNWTKHFGGGFCFLGSPYSSIC